MLNLLSYSLTIARLQFVVRLLAENKSRTLKKLLEIVGY